jgi:hypothetical protein
MAAQPTFEEKQGLKYWRRSSRTVGFEVGCFMLEANQQITALQSYPESHEAMMGDTF